jgi:hypothetical protein
MVVIARRAAAWQSMQSGVLDGFTLFAMKKIFMSTTPVR